MKLLFVTALLCQILLAGIAQNNVGIGITNPSEKLDLNGNMNITGTIKTTGVAGRPGEVLGTNDAGNLAWLSSQRFKYSRMITQLGLVNVTLPTDVTEIMVEQIGAGGGGAFGGGGGSGGYMQVIIKIPAAITSAIVYNGGGGTYATTNIGSGVDGESSSFNIAGNTFSAIGGDAAGFDFPGISRATNTFLPTVICLSSFVIDGRAGHINSYDYVQRSSTIFEQLIKGGQGGTPYMYGMGGEGTEALVNGTVYTKLTYGPIGAFGGGGGGGYTTAGRFGGNGANGVTIIRW